MIRALVAASALACAASAQVASSPGFTLDGVRLQGPADRAASPGFSGSMGQEQTAFGGTLNSSGFEAELGALRIFDPLAADGPTLFDVSPSHGPIAGGTPLTITGQHFDLGGLAAPVTVTIDGVPLSNVTVVSDSTVTGDAPAGTFGPHDVELSTSLGASGLGGGFVHSPGLTTSPIAWRTGEVILRNYGPAGAGYQTNFSSVTTFLPLPPFGTLLIGPAPLVPGIESALYPLPDGVAEVRAPVPDLPTLMGATLHFQSVAVLSLAPLEVQLVNATSTLFQ
ncbi:MAG: IPT/TIG domain-containing protein [Planctomycetota bacterium]